MTDKELIEQVAREVKEGDDFAPIWDVSILLAEHEAVRANVEVGRWLSAALDDPRVCDGMKADINRWFSAGFLYLDEVRRLLEAAHTQGWNEAIEAAAGSICGLVAKHAQDAVVADVADQLRALSVPAIVEAGDE